MCKAKRAHQFGKDRQVVRTALARLCTPYGARQARDDEDYFRFYFSNSKQASAFSRHDVPEGCLDFRPR